MIKNFEFTQCNSTISVFEHQSLLDERLSDLYCRALHETNATLEDDMYDITTRKVIELTGGMYHTFSSIVWNEETLSLLSRYLTKEEKALLIYTTYTMLDAKFILKHECLYQSLFDKITKYLGVVVLGIISFNGINVKFNTLDLFENVRDIDAVQKQDIDSIFVESILFKQSNDYHRYWFKETWDEIIDTENYNKHPMFPIIIDVFGTNPKDVTARDMLIIMRTKLGLTQREFSERYNIPLGTYNHWEQGVRKPLDYVMSMLYRLVADDLLFAESHNLHSVYSILSSYAVNSSTGSKPYVCIETNDGIIVENPNYNDEVTTSLIVHDSFFNKRVFYLTDVISKLPDVTVLEHSFMKLHENVSILKIKLDISFIDYGLKSLMEPKVSHFHMKNIFDENETFNFSLDGYTKDTQTVDLVLSQVYSYVINNIFDILKTYAGITPVGDNDVEKYTDTVLTLINSIYDIQNMVLLLSELIFHHYRINGDWENVNDVVSVWANCYMGYGKTTASYLFEKFSEFRTLIFDSDTKVKTLLSMREELDSNDPLFDILAQYDKK